MRTEERLFRQRPNAGLRNTARPGTSLRSDTRGQSLVELALILPLLFLLIVNVVNFGGVFFAWIAVADAARTGAQYWITGGGQRRRAFSPGRRAGRCLGD